MARMITLRLSDSAYEAVKRYADADQQSMNSWIEGLLDIVGVHRAEEPRYWAVLSLGGPPRVCRPRQGSGYRRNNPASHRNLPQRHRRLHGSRSSFDGAGLSYDFGNGLRGLTENEKWKLENISSFSTFHFPFI